MPVQLDPVKLAAALQELGVTPAALQAIRSAPSEKGPALLNELKLAAKLCYRKLAFELHPDRNGGDAAKTEKFSFLSQVIKQIESMEYRAAPPASVRPAPARPGPPPPPQVIRRVVFRAVPSVSIYNNRTGTSTTPGPGPGAPRGVAVVFLRPT